MRNINRRKFYKSDGLTATLSFFDPILVVRGFVADLSPAGIAVILENSIQEDLRTKHCKITLSFKGKEVIDLDGCILSTTDWDNGKKARLGLVLTNKIIDRKSRILPRIPVNSYFPATLSCKHPFLYKHDIYFRIIDMSPNGLGLITSLSNKFLYKNMIIESVLHLPKVGSFRIDIQIQNVSVKSDHLHVNSSFLKKDHEVQNAICKYLILSDPSISLSSLKAYGFKPSELPVMIFDYAEATEFNEICNLRHQSYGAGNPVVASLQPTDLIDYLDEYSRHIVYRVNGSIVSSARIIFNNGLRERTELWSKYQIAFDDNTLQNSFVEVSKFCVSPNYQKTDLAINLVTQVIKIAHETDHAYIVCTCEKKLYAYYTRMGFTEMGASFDLKEHNTTLFPLKASVDDLLKNDFASSLREFLKYEV